MVSSQRLSCVQSHIRVKPNSSWVVVRLGLFCGWVGVLTIINSWWLEVGCPSISLYRAVVTIRRCLDRIWLPCTAQKQNLEFLVEDPELIWRGSTAYMVVQSDFQFKPNFCWIRLGWFGAVLWLSWGFDNTNWVMAGGGVGSPSCPKAGTELW